MERLKNAKFMQLVRYPTDDPNYPQELEEAYEDFAILVCRTTFADEVFEKRYNILSASLVYLRAFQQRAHLIQERKHIETISFFVETMANFVESQINLLNLSLQYPKSFEKPNRDKIVSPFRWSDKFTKNDMIELIAALDASGAVESRNGGKASFRELVTGFELLFNVNLSNAYNKRDEVLSRKIKTTNFLKQLTDALIEKSQK